MGASGSRAWYAYDIDVTGPAVAITLEEYRRMNGLTETAANGSGAPTRVAAPVATASRPGEGHSGPDPVRSCEWCGAELPAGADRRLRYCSPAHKRAAKAVRTAPPARRAEVEARWRKRERAEAERAAVSAGPEGLEPSRVTPPGAVDVAPSGVAGNGSAGAHGQVAAGRASSRVNRDAPERSPFPPAAGEVAAVTLELLECGAEVELQSPGGWRLVAHPRA